MTIRIRPSLTVVALALLGAVVAISPAAAQSGGVPVTLEAADGVALKATYYAAGKPGPGLLLLHQCNAERSTWDAFARQATARGFHVIAMDYRGYGESEGQRFQSPQEQGPVVAQKWPGDVDAAFAWLIAQPGVDRNRIGASGASCGVNQSVQLARRHPEVKTVVLLSGGLEPAARTYLQQSAWLPVMGAASADDGNAIDTMRWNLAWSRHPGNKMVEFKAAGHGTEMFAVEPQLQPAMLEWFETHLIKSPVTASSTAPAGKPSAVETFWTTLTQPGGAAKARQLFEDARTRGDQTVLFPENEANAYGYQLLQDEKPQEAIIVFEMNAAAYPRSANTYDSLSDGHLAAGNRAEALRFAEKALQVLAADTVSPDEFKATIRESAERKVKQLKGGGKMQEAETEGKRLMGDGRG